MTVFQGLKLQRGDKDQPDPIDPTKPPRYEGRQNHDIPAGTKLVAQLQELLSRLGFDFIKPKNGEFDGCFGPLTEMAVREFQLYAASEYVAMYNPLSKEKGERFFHALVSHRLGDECMKIKA